MLSLQLAAPRNGPLTVLAVGAHPDDIEIGAGGTLLTLARSYPGLRVQYTVLTGTAARQAEARQAARAFLPQADVAVELHQLPDGRLPAAWSRVKEVLEQIAGRCSPDLILAPWHDDAHQDHRTVAEIMPTVFRDGLLLSYEIPKWDGDLGRPSVYFPLPAETARLKVDLLNKSFPSQHRRDWWDEEIFLGLARLRGTECRTRYAEAFHCSKSVITIGPDRAGETVEETPGNEDL
jgi:LmbE family N-acetylglucosaminyl deacetylase